MTTGQVRRALVFLVVFAVVVVAFRPSFDAGWVAWDDDTNFLTNPNFRGLGPEQLRWMWGTFHLGIWIPLSWMTLGANYLLFGMEPAGYHATNVLIHALNAVLLTQLGIDVIGRATGQATVRHAQATDGIGASSNAIDTPTISGWALPVSAACGALMFAVHPLRVESVTWITERRDVLSGLFYLGTVLAFIRFADDGPRRRWWHAVTWLSFVLALLAKGTAVTIPGALALLWWYPLGRIGGTVGWNRAAWWRAIQVIAPFGVVALGFAVVVLRGLEYPTQLPWSGKLAVSAYSWCFYLAHTLWPAGLSPLYGMPEPLDATAPRFLLSAGVVLISALIGWRLHRRAPGVVMAILGFSVIVLPLLGLHQGGPQIVADRNTYNASFVLALLAGGAVYALWRRMPRAPWIAPTAAVLVLSALVVVTWRQQRYWHDSEQLWLRVLDVEPDNPHGHNNYGNVLMAEGRTNEALERYAWAVELRPTFAPALANLGVALGSVGRTDEAIVMLTRAVAADSSHGNAEANLGAALMRAGDIDGAVAHLQRAVAINPANADAEVNWGNALVRRGAEGDALVHYARAIALRPDHADGHFNWGVALARRGDLAGAAEHFRTVLQLQPGNDAARQYLQQVEAQLQSARPR